MRAINVIKLLWVIGLLTACTPKWQHVRERNQAPSATASVLASGEAVTERYGLSLSAQNIPNLHFSLPDQWVMAPTVGSNVLITKDGLLLQQIGIKSTAVEYVFNGRLASQKESISPQELAEMQLVDLRFFQVYPAIQTSVETRREKGLLPMVDAIPDVSTIKRVAIRPIRVGAKPAFELVTSMYNLYGLAYRMHTVGVIHQHHYYRFHYLAPMIHYFDRDYHVFQDMLSGVEFK